MFGSDRNPGLVYNCIRDIFEDIRLREQKRRVANVIVTMFQVTTK